MPITQTFPIEKYLQEQIKRQERVIIRTLMYIGEQCLNIARNTDSYLDQTGNLRSSIGYVVALDGDIRYVSNFNIIKTGTTGTHTGAQYARKLISEYPKGAVLLMVAGMSYASYVSNRGYDVLDSAELQAERLLNRLLKQMIQEHK